MKMQSEMENMIKKNKNKNELTIHFTTNLKNFITGKNFVVKHQMKVTTLHFASMNGSLSYSI